MIALFERVAAGVDALGRSIESLGRSIESLAASQARARYDAQVLGGAVEEQIALARATAMHLGVTMSDERSYVRRDD